MVFPLVFCSEAVLGDMASPAGESAQRHIAQVTAVKYGEGTVGENFKTSSTHGTQPQAENQKQ